MTHDRQVERGILLQDLATVVLALWLAHVLRDRLVPIVPGLKPAVPTTEYAHVLLVFLPTWAWCAERLALNRIRTLRGPLIELLRALLWTQAWGATALALILVAAQVGLNRSLIALFLVLSTGLLLTAKLLQRSWIRHHRGRALALLLSEAPIATAGELERLRGRQVERLESLYPTDLRRRLRAGGVDEVVLSDDLPRDYLRPLLKACEEVGVPALVRVERIDLDLARPRAEVVGPTLYLAYRTHDPDRPALLIKAILDRVLAAAALLVSLPVIVVLALLVKLTSPGPVFFIQTRGGLNGRPFRMLKFRTMREGAEAERDALLQGNEMDGPVFKVADDPRVTSLGGILRRTSLDELPQLVNVLLGHMSLVGPRPLPLIETKELTGVHRRRLSVKPGITGLWQVSGRNDLTFREWMALDLQYIDNWSLGLDLAILLRTVPTVLGARGAR